jgi:hypothetical protein
MPEIAKACEPFTDPTLRDKAFDLLAAAAQNDTGTTYGGIAPESSYTSGFNPISASALPVSSYTADPSSTRLDNGRA